MTIFPTSPNAVRPFLAGLVLALAGCASAAPPETGQAEADADGRSWLAGDHHVHSRYSVGWDYATDPPSPIIGGDAIYPIPMNALMGRRHGLSWMVATDHGGPGHSRVNFEQAYPEFLESREAVPDVVQFWGMEFDTPGADHSSLIVPHTHDEADHLHDIESRFAKRDPWPADDGRDAEPFMLEALEAMDDLEDKPVVIANHPSRSATGLGEYGLDRPAELRDWNDAAPEIAVGMAGAPGHQAAAIAPDGSLEARPRGGYGRHPTMGGFDQMTARLGGFWDSMLGEGRRWWITANSDSHVHWREGGSDFWPGEYSKTYVRAHRTHDDVLAGIRGGRVFVTTGDLISALEVRVGPVGGPATARIGGTAEVEPGADVAVTVRFLDPDTVNAHGDDPSVARVDLIVGEVTGPVADRSADTNPTTRVAARFGPREWTREGRWRTVTHVLEDVTGPLYVRVRGTNGTEEEPLPDPAGEDPWSDLWFYGNPVFVEVR